MNKCLLPEQLIPPGIDDQRSRDFLETLNNVLSRFKPSDVLIQDPYTVDARLLPIMIVENGLTDFVLPQMNEISLRKLIAAAPQIHAKTGTVKGIRIALGAIGASMTWVQWFEEQPKAHHNTHKVSIFFETSLFDDGVPGDERHKEIAHRLIRLIKRKSQDVAINFGVQTTIPIFVGAFATNGGTHTAALPIPEPKAPAVQLLTGVAPLAAGVFKASMNEEVH